eukprot:GHVQ01019256.1.p1 GENE.GHVQ01019256.1~~GHVQ01019256.1.p1  ORF type:complete len:481 (+),score=49.85 GHVQ01019256.1:109-1551(+)
MSIVGGGNTSMLQVTIASARGLPAKDINGLSDPYCKFYWKGQKYKSSVQKKTLSPKWNEIFLLPFDVVQGPFQLHIEIWDYDTFGSNEYMATCELDLSSISATSEASEGQYKLQGPGASGVLNLKLQLLKSPLPKKEHNTGQLSHSSHAQLKASTQVVVQSHQSPPAAVHLYPSLSPPAAVPPQRPPPPYPSNIVGNGEHNTVSSVPPGDLKAVKEILPQCSYNQISDALIQTQGDKEAAIDLLLNQIIAHQHSPQPPPPVSSTPDYTSFAPPARQNIPDHNFGVQQAPPCAPQVAPSGRKKALLIGINYLGDSCQLRGCINDVRRMKALLIGLYGFPDTPNTMVCLTDDNPDHRYRPTRANITMGMTWLAADARPGDSLWLHFSGHGAQQRDHTGMEQDGYDETILPCDFTTSGQIVDDEIQAALVRPLPSGCRMTAVMDCCHSGTGMDLPFWWNPKKTLWEEEDNPFFVMGDVQLFSG